MHLYKEQLSFAVDAATVLLALILGMMIGVAATQIPHLLMVGLPRVT
jgi:hypothetical protein